MNRQKETVHNPKAAKAAVALSTAAADRLRRNAFLHWIHYAQEKQRQTHMRRCSVLLKYNNLKSVYAKFFLRWLSAAQRSRAQQARDLTVLPKDVPLKGRKDVLALVRRYFGKWRQHLRETRQRCESNTGLLVRVNQERSLWKTYVAWQVVTLRNNKTTTASLHTSVKSLEGAALRAIDTLGGRGASRKEFKPMPNETAEYAAQRAQMIVNTLLNLCEDLVVVLVNASLWSQDRASERVSEALERLWNRTKHLEGQNAQLQAENQSLNAVVSGVNDMLRAAEKSATDGTPLTQQQRDAILAEATEKAKQQSQHGNRRALDLVRASDKIVGVLSGANLNLESDLAELQQVALLAIDAVGGKGMSENFRAPEQRELVPEALRELVKELQGELQNGDPSLPICERLAGMRENIKHLEEQLTEAREENEKLQVELEKTEENLSARKDENADLKRQLADLAHSSNRDLTQLNKTAKQQIEQLEKELDQVQKGAEKQAAQQVAEKDTLLRGLIKAVETLGGPAAVKDSFRPVTEGANTITMTPRESEKRVRGVVDAVTNLSSDINRLLSEEEAKLPLRDTLRKLRGDADEARRSSERLGQKLEERTQERDQLRADAKEHQSKLREAAKELGAVQKQLNDANRELAALRSAQQGDQEDLAALRAAATQTLQMLRGDGALAQINHSPQSAALSPRSPSAFTPRSSTAVTPRSESRTPGAEVRARRGIVTPADARSQDISKALTGATAEVKQLLDAALESNVRNASVEDLIRALKKELDQTRQDDEHTKESLQKVQAKDVELGSLCVFLRDVLRDTISRLSVFTSDATSQSRSALNSLFLTKDPPPLTLDSDPSVYTEYILRSSTGSDEVRHRAVQDHMRSGAVLTAKKGDPATWDIVAEYHDQMALLLHLLSEHEEIIMRQKGHIDSMGQQSSTLEAEVESAMHRLGPWVDPAEEEPGASPIPVAPIPPLQHVADCVVTSLEQMRAAADTAGAAPAAHTHSLPHLVERIEQLAADLVHFREAAKYSLSRLGAPASETAAADDKALCKALEELCGGTADAIENLKEQFQLKDAAGNVIPIQEIYPKMQEKMQEMETATSAAEHLINGLDRAFDDDDLDGTVSSTSSTWSTAKDVKPKKKPLPASAGRVVEGFYLKHRGMKGKRIGAATMDSGTSLENRLRMIRASASSKLAEVQELRNAARTALAVLAGTHPTGDKPLAVGESLVPLLLSTLQEIKKTLPDCLSALADVPGFSPDRENSVGTLLKMLTDQISSLALQKDGLRDQLAAKDKVSKRLMNTSDDKAARLEEQLTAVNKKLAETQQKYQDLEEKHKDLNEIDGHLEEELEEEKVFSNELKKKAEQLKVHLQNAEAKVGDLGQQLHAALAAEKDLDQKLSSEVEENKRLSVLASQQQHENNVLLDGVARALEGLDKFADEPTIASPAKAESLIAQLLRSDDGNALADYVDRCVASGLQRNSNLAARQKVSLDELREDLVALREMVITTARQDFAALCCQAHREVASVKETLQLENDLLRPRAVERERFAAENKRLVKQVEQTESQMRALQDQVEALEDKTIALQRALRDSELRNTMEATPPKMHYSSPEKKALEDGRHADLLAELERKMIHGASGLAVEAIDAMSGENMSATYGHIAEQTLALYDGIEACMQQLQQCGKTYPPSTVAYQRAFITEVEVQMRQMEKLSTEAQTLWSLLPTLYRAA